MNILFYRWYGITEPNVINNLKKLGHTVYEYDRKFNNYEVDASLMQELVFLKHEKKIDMFFSLDYYPFLSSTANVLEIPYISWVFD